MKKAILRNIAIVSAIFIVSFSIMLITNYFQVRNATPLQTEVIETLRELNNQNADNPALQEQIRQLDLMARQAYFSKKSNLMAGVYILLGMLVAFIVCTRLYFAKEKDIPDKEIDPIDEWAIKTKARKYVVWGASALAAVALIFVVMTAPHLQTKQSTEESLQNELVAQSNDFQGNEEIISDEIFTEEGEESAVNDEGEIATEEVVEETKVTHNAFRGNNSIGITPARGIPVKWDLKSGANIAWRTEIPLQGMSSPVINSNKVFITAADENTRELLCYDLETGKQLWKLAATNIPGSPGQVSADALYYKEMVTASTPATNGTQVIAIFPTGDIIAADMNGKRLWAKNLGVPDNHYGYASSLLIFGNFVIVQYDNRNSPRVMALDVATGAERWSVVRTERVATTWSSPIIAYVNNVPQLVLMGNPNITAYNPNNGQQIWQVGGLSGEVGASAAAANGIIFGASEYAKMMAINGTDGTILWESREYLPSISSPVATRNNVYLATEYGVVASFNAQTGDLRKEHDFGGKFYSSLMLVEGRIYLFNTDGKAYIFAANDDFTLLDSFETGEKTYATPAFTNGKMVVRTDNSIYCVVTK
jgi:outer membrane protein assembly factor BamB